MLDEDFADVTSHGNRTIALVLAFIIAFISIFGYFFVYQKFHFSLNTVTVELGSTISYDVNYYLKKKVVDTSGYKLDVSRVKSDEVGTYSYSITYNTITKKGKVKVVDTTPPVFEIGDVTVEVGDESFYIGNALTKCEDASELCLASFKNESDAELINSIGKYLVTVVVEDLYKNKSETTINLNVVEKGSIILDEEKDLEYDHSSVELPNFSNEYYLKFDKAYNKDSEELEDLISEIHTETIEEYVKNNYSGYTLSESEIVEMYNKSDYVIGIVIKLTINNGNDKIVYMTK